MPAGPSRPSTTSREATARLAATGSQGSDSEVPKVRTLSPPRRGTRDNAPAIAGAAMASHLAGYFGAARARPETHPGRRRLFAVHHSGGRTRVRHSTQPATHTAAVPAPAHAPS